MNCHNHPDRSAVGICKACYKGLCSECATDLGLGLSCKGDHEKYVNNINMVIEKNVKVYSEAGKNSFIGPAFTIFMGSVFTYQGYVSSGKLALFMLLLGGGFIFFGMLTFVRSRRLFGKNA